MTLKDLEKIVFKGFKRKVRMEEGDLLNYIIQAGLAEDKKQAKEYLNEWRKDGSKKYNGNFAMYVIQFRHSVTAHITYQIRKKFKLD